MNMIRHGLLSFTLLVALTSMSAALGFSAELTDLVATVEQGYQSLSDLQAEFKQKTSIAAINRSEKGGGELFLRRRKGDTAAQFRFDYTKPAQQIVSDGKTLWYYVPESKQVMVSDMAAFFAGGNGLAMTYLTGMGQLSKDFTAKSAGRDKQGNYLLDLTPKKPSAVLTKLQLTVTAAAVDQYLVEKTAKVPFPLTASVIVDAAGNRTEISYSKVKVNRGLGSERFKFKTPAGVTTVKQ
jgi:outer membrane lipoprotein carrier protein